MDAPCGKNRGLPMDEDTEDAVLADLDTRNLLCWHRYNVLAAAAAPGDGATPAQAGGPGKPYH